jgi:hypothetical protein
MNGIVWKPFCTVGSRIVEPPPEPEVAPFSRNKYSSLPKSSVGTDFNFGLMDLNVNMFENTLLRVMQPAMSRKGVAISLSRRREIVWTYCEVLSFSLSKQTIRCISKHGNFLFTKSE